MKKGEWEAPPHYHCINAAGTIIMVDDDVRKEVEAALRNCKYPEDHFETIVIESIIGETVTIVLDAVNIIYSTDPEIRCKHRHINTMMTDERMEQGFTEDD